MTASGRLAGKVALISGGARGMGAAQVSLFAREGASIVFGDVRDELGRALEAGVRAQGGDATYLHLDVSDEEQWRGALENIEKKHGRINVLVSNAAIPWRRSIEATTCDDWDRVMAVNARGVFLATKFAIPLMRQSGGGSIVNIASTAALIATVSGGAAYAASKGAVRAFTKTAAVQHAKDGIRCNLVHPGPIDTEFSAAERLNDSEETKASRARETVGKVLFGRMGTADEVAFAVLYLASDESSFLTGTEIVVDGGTTAY